MAGTRLIYGVAFLCVISSVFCTPEEDEQNDNAVELTFYRVTVSHWQSEGLYDKVASRIADAANAFCGSDPTACGMESCCTSAFKVINVGTNPGYPTAAKNGKDLILSVYLTYPASSPLREDNSLKFVLDDDVVEDIVGQARDGIFTDTGLYITFVGKDFYGIAPADLENKIIIPIAFAVLIAVIIVAVVLYYWSEKRKARERKRRMLEKRKKTKVVPVYHKENEGSQPPAATKEPQRSETAKDKGKVSK